MRTIKQTISSGLLAIVASVSIGLALAPNSANAADCTGAECARQGANEVKTGGDKSADISAVMKTVVNVLLFIVGTVAVIMVVIGGLKYTTSNGDSNQVSSAKNTILYAVIGVVVAIMGYAIVNFVIGSFV